MTAKFITVDDLATAPSTLSPDEIQAKIDGSLGLNRIHHVHGSTYKDNSTVIVVPARDKFYHHWIVSSWRGLITPMNHARYWFDCVGDEVGKAYDRMVTSFLDHPVLGKARYVMTMETDNLQPPDAHIRLLESIEEFKLDAVSGIYFTKGEVGMPMAYGDPAEYARTGVLEFRPRDIRSALINGRVLEVNGIAMGCSLYRMELFRQIPPPWFVTVNDLTANGIEGITQDLNFCAKAKMMGKRFGVDMRVRVGHLDFATDTVY